MLVRPKKDTFLWLCILISLAVTILTPRVALYLDYKDDIEAIKTDKKYNYINEVAVKFLKNVDTTGYIKTFNRELKRKKKNERNI